MYSQQVEEHHRLMYANSVHMVASQTREPFGSGVTDVQARGQAMSAADLIGKVKYSRGEDRSRRNPENPVKGHRRWLIRPTVIESGQYFDIEDDLDGQITPNATKLRRHTEAIVNGKSDITCGIEEVEDGVFTIGLNGILGKASEGQRPGAGVPLPSSQYIPHGSTGLTLDKIMDARLALRKKDFGVESGDQTYCAITAQQEDDLLKIAAQTQQALNAYSLDQLRDGKPTRLLGIDWVMTNRLPVNASERRILPMWTKRNIVRGIWQDVTGDLWNDTSAKNLPYGFVSAFIDCVRLEDIGVIAIECAES